MKPAEAQVTQEDVELAERLHDGVNARIEVLLSELRGLLRQARITPKTIAQRAEFAKLEAARIAAAPKIDDLIDGVAAAARAGEIRSPDSPEERALDEAFMRWQIEKADGMTPSSSAAARARMGALVSGELGAREALDELHEPRAVPDMAAAIEEMEADE